MGREGGEFGGLGQTGGVTASTCLGPDPVGVPQGGIGVAVAEGHPAGGEFGGGGPGRARAGQCLGGVLGGRHGVLGVTGTGQPGRSLGQHLRVAVRFGHRERGGVGGHRPTDRPGHLVHPRGQQQPERGQR
ncbi:hypothetical protein AB0J90_10875 [Micromonospora sp. NPDC049523]|uniref:hypothetical protein n=1 Tax=Micromonospora sp. NPDC049523 TaxID=3155921 RepID=UPI00343E7E1D